MESSGNSSKNSEEILSNGPLDKVLRYRMRQHKSNYNFRIFLLFCLQIGFIQVLIKLYINLPHSTINTNTKTKCKNFVWPKLTFQWFFLLLGLSWSLTIYFKMWLHTTCVLTHNVIMSRNVLIKMHSIIQ